MSAALKRQMEIAMATQEDLSTIIGRIVQNPEFAEMVSSIKGEENSGSSEDITKEMMSKLPDVIAMVSPILGGGDEKEEKKGDVENQKESVVSANPLLTHQDKSPKKYDKTRAEKLLCALKPYLNRERCEIIDKCVSVMQITDVVGAFQGLDVIGGLAKKNIGGEEDLHT